MEFYRYIIFYSVAFLASVSFKNVLSKSVYNMEVKRQSHSHKLKVGDETYMQRRERILLTEQHQKVGGEIVLTKAEQKVNDILMSAKQKEVNASLFHGKPFAPQMSFIKSKDMVEQSDVFKLIKRMPKGGALHVHDCSITDIDWLVSNVTYRNNCYMCYDNNGSISFMFFDKPPVNQGCPWKLVDKNRKAHGDAKTFDETLRKSMLITEDFIHQDIGPVWKRFEEILIRANGLINYAPVFAEYYYEALKELNEDNVQYVEVRALLPQIYELDGSLHDAAYVMEVYKNTTEKFKTNYTNFTGAKIIKTNLRFLSPQVILEDVKNSIQLMQKFPDFFAGYDLVGQEGPGEPLLYYLDALRYPILQSPPVNLPYFFHAGETDWEGTRVDDNLIDAILLNTSRIGHGYALTKHPEVMRLVKQNGIAIEVNPISNQVLKLVDDLRNHPASDLLAQGFPVVISSDDPAVWGARGLSYDFYMAFMALSGEDDGLEVLKQLSMNSLLYSALSKTDKITALRDWEIKWNTFITDTLSEH